MNEIPEWFDLRTYSKQMSLGEWAYEIWIRSQYYRHASFFSDSGFVVHSSIGPLNKMVAHILGDGCPVGKENYLNFLKNREYFKSYFLAKTQQWGEEKDRPTVELYDIEDILPREQFNELPAQMAKDDFEMFMYHWCEKSTPIGINLEKTDEELVREFKNILKFLRNEQKEFYTLSKCPAEKVAEWHNFKLLALFDLLFYREAFAPTLTHTKIGNMLWPNDEIEIEQRIRKKGLPLIEKVFSSSVAKVLYFEHLKMV